MMRTAVLISCLLAGLSAGAQGLGDLSNLRAVQVRADTGWTTVDSLSIVPGSMRARCPDGSRIEGGLFEVDHLRGRVQATAPLPCETVFLRFRVYPYRIGRVFSRRDGDAYRRATLEDGFIVNASGRREDGSRAALVDFGDLDYTGSITRGLSLGNNQSLNLNSNFSLQLAGNITDDIEITAAITDNDVPIQPEGNTQQLQEFDRVFIRLTKDRHSLTAGDYDLAPTQGYFLRFKRNLQGASYAGGYDAGRWGDVSGRASFAVARGRYAINDLTAQEGNQGPYQLTGINGETLIIVLAGSERVFVNEQLRTRGANEDYVIDYNTGTITFTPNLMITQDLRIRVEFEYAERNFFRSLFHVQAQHEVGRVRTFVNLFSEQDAKNQPINLDLDDDVRAALQAAGDSVDQAFFSGATEADFEEGRILYRRVDSVIDGQPRTVYVYSTDPEATLYTVSFSRVGEGQGHYRPADVAANGRVFEFVAPVSGTPQGSYEPVVRLPTPKLRRMVTGGVEIATSDEGSVRAEVAWSDRDVNTLSDADDADDRGLGIFLGFDQTIRLGDSTRPRRLDLSGRHEFRQDRFEFIEYYRRDVNLARNWSLEDPNARVNEHLGGVEAALSGRRGRTSYALSYFIRDSVSRGVENHLTGRYQHRGWLVDGEVRALRSNAGDVRSDFIRPRFSVGQAISRLGDWRWEAGIDHEINRRLDTRRDSLSDQSFLWQEYHAAIRSPDSLRNAYGFNYSLRYQHLPDGRRFDDPYLTAHTATVNGRVSTRSRQTLNWQLTYRRLIQDTLQQADDDLAHFYLGRIDYTFQFLDGVVRGNSLYEIGAGREQRIQYNYIEAPDGQGNYAWDDLNDNGVQELSEFFVSPFADQNRFLRLTTNTPEFIPINTTRLNQNLSLTPRARWRDDEGFQRIISKVSTVSAVQVERKVFTDGGLNPGRYLSPFSAGITDDLLVANNLSMRHVVFINQIDPQWGVEYAWTLNRNQVLLTSGFERRLLNQHSVRVRWRMLQSLTLESTYRNGVKGNDSDFFFDRRYRYVLNDLETALSWLYGTKIRWTASYRYGFRTNPVPVTGGQFAVVHEASTELRYNQLSKGSITTSFTYAGIGYETGGVENEQLRFDMLEGLDRGTNLIWTVGVDRRLFDNLQLTVGYEGRKTGSDNPVVHVGRAQVRAIF